MGTRKKCPSVNENWTKTEVVNLIKEQAKKQLEICKKREAEKPGKWVLVSKFPNTYKKIVQ